MQIESRTSADRSSQAPSHEHLRLRAGHGSEAYATFQLIEQAPVISELAVELNFKANRSGLQFFVRAVLPRNATDRGPKTVLLPGPTYTNVGQWQTLRLSDLPGLLERHIRIHRAASQEWLDTREAFVDLVAVNIYGGHGKTDVWLAQPKVDGATVQRSRTETELQSLQRLPTIVNHEVRIVGSAINIDRQPFAPRIIQPNGEAWPFLRELGFNTIWLKAAPSAEQMAKAEQLDLWLVAQVPSLRNYSVLDSHLYRRVIAWDLQRGSRSQLEQQELADQIRFACGTKCKPLLCSDPLDPAANSRFADIVVHEPCPLGTTQSLEEHTTRLEQNLDKSVPMALHWTTLSTHVPISIQRQIALLDQAASLPTLSIEPAQLTPTAISSLASGTRAFCVIDSDRLDGDDPQSQLRVLALRQLNRLHRLFAPWLLSGKASSIEPTQLASLRLAVFETNQSTLAVPLPCSNHQQLCGESLSSQRVSLTMHRSSDLANVYLIRLDGLEKIASRRVAGGTQFEVEDLSNVVAILMTSDDRIAGTVAAKLRSMLKPLATTQQTIVRLLSSENQRSQRIVRTVASGNSQNDSTDKKLNDSLSASKTNRFHDAVRLAHRATSLLQSKRRSEWEQVIQQRPPAAYPLSASYTALPSLRRWQTSIPQVACGVNLLRGGDFEQMERLLAESWIAHRNNNASLATQISLTEHGRQGKCLRIAVQGDRFSSSSNDFLAWVETPPIEIARGQQVRIDGWVRVRSNNKSTLPTAVLFDTWAGTPLAQRWFPSDGWQAFTLFRIGTGEPLTVRCALVGPGELLIDDLSISPMSDAAVTHRTLARTEGR